MKEKWKRWKYHGEKTRYKISNMGQIHDTKKNKYTYGYINKSGYMQWTFYLKDGSSVTKLVHRLVAKLFVDKENEDFNEIDHINAIKTDNRANNLRWCTNKMNIEYAKEKGLMKKEFGEKSPRHKYTNEQINLVIKLLKDGKYTKKEISKMTGVHVHTIGDIAHKKIWKENIPDDKLCFKNSHRKFSDEQIMQVIRMLNGQYSIKEISDITNVSKSVIRSILKHESYSYLTKNMNLYYKKISKRARIDQINKAIELLETKSYSSKDIMLITGLSRSIVEKIAYHQRWTELTNGKDLGFKGSKT